MSHDFPQIAAVVVFVLTYLAIAWGRFPGLRLDRAGAALAGATCMIGTGVLSLPEAYAAIDWNTITLLLGVMIVVANLRLSGLFGVISASVARHSRRPLVLLGAVILVSGCLSAFLVNDTICLALTPLVLETTVALRRDPIPYLLAVAVASNAGSVATITGNPQNMIIGNLAHIPYTAFAAALAPVAAASLLLAAVVIAVAFRAEFGTRAVFETPPRPRTARPNRILIVKSGLITAGMVVGFFYGLPPPAVAIAAGVLMLLTRRVKPERIYTELDWPLLLMFTGLFIVVAGVERSLLTPATLDLVGRLHLQQAPILTALTAVLSNIVSNVPAVLVLHPFLGHLAQPQRAWLIVSMAATLAGNFTLVGSVANLIVAERARALGVTIAFGTYFKVGAPLTLLSLLLGTWWLSAS